MVRVSHINSSGSQEHHSTYRFRQVVCDTSTGYDYSNSSNGIDNSLVLRSPVRYSVPNRRRGCWRRELWDVVDRMRQDWSRHGEGNIRKEQEAQDTLQRKKGIDRVARWTEVVEELMKQAAHPRKRFAKARDRSQACDECCPFDAKLDGAATCGSHLIFYLFASRGTLLKDQL
jgi:hypothetical protein